MDNSIGVNLLMAFAILGGLTCIYGILHPRPLVNWVTTFWDKPPSLYLAVLVRLILGALLLWVAPETKFPLGFAIFGYLALTAAVVIPLLGREKIGRLLNWLRDAPSPALRLWLVVGLILSCFIFFGL